MIWLVIFCSFSFHGILSSTVQDLEVIRNSDLHPTSLIRVVDPSDAAELEAQAIANASSNLSNTSLADIENDNNTHTLQMKHRERKRQERLMVIQTQILQRLRIQKQPNITASLFSEDNQKKIEIMVGRMQNMRPMESDLYGYRAYVQRLQSFYPSCSLPNSTDKTIWERQSSFRVYYDIPFSRWSSGTQLTVMRAKLRLFKFGNPEADPNYVNWETHLASLPRFNRLDSILPRRVTNAINVNIYQFLKPVRLNRKERKRLVDSRTITADYQGWVDFDVLPALNYWVQHNNKNFGFDVTVEDSFGKKLNASYHFQSMNCSVESASQDPPFPNFMELNTDMGENESSLFDNETYPTLDLKTAEISGEDTEVQVGDFNRRVVKKRHVYSQRLHRKLRTKCRREQIYVSFAEMGLDGIIVYPEGINWAFCGGSCDDSKNKPHHKRQLRRKSFLQQIFPHWNFPWHRTQESNCIAGDKDSLSLIYYDEDSNDLQKTTIADFIPKDCICKLT